MTSLFLESLPQPKGGWSANNALQATRDGVFSSAIAGDVISPACLSFCR